MEKLKVMEEKLYLKKISRGFYLDLLRWPIADHPPPINGLILVYTIY